MKGIELKQGDDIYSNDGLDNDVIGYYSPSSDVYTRDNNDTTARNNYICNDDSNHDDNDYDYSNISQNKGGRKEFDDKKIKQNSKTGDVYIDTSMAEMPPTPSSSSNSSTKQVQNISHILDNKFLILTDSSHGYPDTPEYPDIPEIDDSALYSGATTISVNVGKDLKPSLVMTKKKKRLNASTDMKEIILKSTPGGCLFYPNLQMYKFMILYTYMYIYICIYIYVYI
jgi:hypothetical protein